jgi:hypothetical protein
MLLVTVALVKPAAIAATLLNPSSGTGQQLGANPQTPCFEMGATLPFQLVAYTNSSSRWYKLGQGEQRFAPTKTYHLLG